MRTPVKSVDTLWANATHTKMSSFTIAGASKSWSILVLSYNHPELTIRTIESCIRATSSQQIPINVIHNGSLTKHREQVLSRFETIPLVQHLVLEKNRGFSGGANHGLNHLFNNHNLNWVFFITNDCELLNIEPPSSTTQPCGLGAPLIYRRKQGRIDSLGGYFDPQNAKIWHNQNSHWPQQDQNQNPQSKTNPQYPTGTNGLSSILPYIPGTAFWIHSSTWRSLGGFDERLETYWEDVDLSVHAQNIGQTLFAAPTTQLIHAVGKTNHKNQYATSYLFQRNRVLVSRKHSSIKRRHRLLFELKILAHWLQIFAQPSTYKDPHRLKLLAQAFFDSYRPH